MRQNNGRYKRGRVIERTPAAPATRSRTNWGAIVCLGQQAQLQGGRRAEAIADTGWWRSEGRLPGRRAAGVARRGRPHLRPRRRRLGRRLQSRHVLPGHERQGDGRQLAQLSRAEVDRAELVSAHALLLVGIAPHLRQVPQAGAAQGLEARLGQDQDRPASRHVQRLQLHEQQARGHRARGHERGPARGVRDAAHVVRAGDDQRRPLHRRRLPHGRQPDGGDPARRRRALDHLDREPQGEVEGRLHRHLLPDHRDDGQRPPAARPRPHRGQQPGDRCGQGGRVRPADPRGDAGGRGAAALPRQRLLARVHRCRRAGHRGRARLVPRAGHDADVGCGGQGPRPDGAHLPRDHAGAVRARRHRSR